MFSSKNKWHLAGVIPSASEAPEFIQPFDAILVGSSIRRSKWILFQCPCGRGHRAMINLSSSRSPVWRLSGIQKITLSPSVDDFSIDRCHYFIKNGNTVWVERKF